MWGKQNLLTLNTVKTTAFLKPNECNLQPILVMPLESSLSRLTLIVLTRLEISHFISKVCFNILFDPRCKRCQKEKIHIPGCVKMLHSCTWLCKVAVNMT